MEVCHTMSTNNALLSFETPTLEKLIGEWESDAKIDTTNAGMEMIRIPIIHSKYNKYISLHKLAVARREAELYKLRKQKWMYYNGKMTKEELETLGWEPFPFTLKSDLSIYMDGDVEIQKKRAQITLHEECVSFCTYVMKELASRTYQIKEWMAWERFTGGHGK
jgi:hypothetical protein